MRKIIVKRTETYAIFVHVDITFHIPVNTNLSPADGVWCLGCLNYYATACPHQTICTDLNIGKNTPWSQSASELYRLRDCSLAKLVPTLAERRDIALSARLITYGRNFVFLDRGRYFFFQVAPQLSSRGYVEPIPDPLLLRKSGNVGNRIRTSGSVSRKSDQKTTEAVKQQNAARKLKPNLKNLH
jgi:hypothetical protein